MGRSVGYSIAASTRVRGVRRRQVDRSTRDRAPRVALAATLLIAGFVHVFVSAEHFEQAKVLGATLLLSGLCQLALAALVSRGADTRLLVAAFLATVAFLGVYLANLFVPLPFLSHVSSQPGHVHGPQAEAVDLGGGVVALAETASLLLLARLILRARRRSLR